MSGLAEQPGQPLPSPRVSMSFNTQPGHPFAPPPFRPGAHTRQESSFQSHAFPLPGMYPWSTPPIPSTPVKPSPLGNNSTTASASVSKFGSAQYPGQGNGNEPRGSVHQRSPPTHSQELPTKRQRHRQVENGIGLGRPSRLSISVTASQAAKAARSATAPAGSAVPVRQPFGPSNPSDGPPPFANGARRTWALDPSARATLGHFPHSSLSLPLSGQPLPRHGARQSVSNPGGAFFGPRKTHTSHLSRSHERTPSIPHRVGPPPKAILGGPGGKTFEELRVPSPSRPAPVPSSPTAAASTDLPRPASPSAAPNGDISSPSPQKPTGKEPFEVKHRGTTVRVALPPDVYDPPDTPLEDLAEVAEKAEGAEPAEGDTTVTQNSEAEGKGSGAASDSVPAAGEKPEEEAEAEPDQDTEYSGEVKESGANNAKETTAAVEKPVTAPKPPRKEAFPWPDRKVASPRSVPLPPSPLDEELELSDIENWVAHDTPHGSIDITSSWNGKAVKVSMPPVSCPVLHELTWQESFEALKAKTMSPGSAEPSALYEDAVDEVELALDVKMREATPPQSDEAAEPADPGTARSLPTHLRSESMQSNATATGSDAESSAMPSQSQRRHVNLSLSSNPFLQRSLGGILRGDGRENRSNAPSPVSAAFPQRGELPDWYHDPTMQNTPSLGQSRFIGMQELPQDGFPQQRFLPDWPTDLLPKAEAGEKETSPEPDASEEGEGWGTPQSTPGKDHGHSATKTETEISESLWPSTSASKADEEPLASPTSTVSTADDIVVSVQVTSGPAKEPFANSDDRTVTEEKDLIKLDSDTPSSDPAPRERPRPKVATGFLQRQLQSIMRSDKSKAKPPAALAAPTPAQAAETSASPDVPPTPPSTQEYHIDSTSGSAKEKLERADDHQASERGSQDSDNDGGDESYSADGDDDFVDSPSSPFKPTGKDGEMNGDDAPRHNNPSFKSLSPIGKLKPSASAFVPRAVVTSPPRMVPKVEEPQSERRRPSVTSSTFTFGYPSTVEHRKLSLASTASPRNPSKVLASLPSLQPSAPAFKPTAPAFQPSAPVFQPGAPVFQPNASVFQPGAPAFQPASSGFGASNVQPAGTGGALGLFTFTHNLRPTAAEFRPNGVRLGASPLRQNQSLRPHPPELDLSKADPTSKPFELGSAFFPSNDGKLEFGNGDVSLLMREKRPVKIERPEPPAALLLRRDPASLGQHSQKERDSMSEAVR